MTKEELLNALKKMADRLKDPSLKEQFKDFNQDVQFNFEDLGFSCIMRFRGGYASVEEGVAEAANITITTDSETMLGILSGSKNPTRAFMMGKLKAKGPMKDLLKLQAIMKGE